MELLYDAADLTIMHDRTQGWLYITWEGVHALHAARRCCEEILMHVQATGSTKILNDGSQDCDGWSELAGWLANEFFCQLATSGVVAVAWVTPHNLQAHATMNKVLQAVTRPNVLDFKDVESAYTWLCHA